MTWMVNLLCNIYVFFVVSFNKYNYTLYTSIKQVQFSYTYCVVKYVFLFVLSEVILSLQFLFCVGYGGSFKPWTHDGLLSCPLNAVLVALGYGSLCLPETILKLRKTVLRCAVVIETKCILYQKIHDKLKLYTTYIVYYC